MPRTISIPGDGTDADEVIVIPDEYAARPEEFLALKIFGGFKKIDRNLDGMNKGIEKNTEAAQEAIQCATAAYRKAEDVEGALSNCQVDHELVEDTADETKARIWEVVKGVVLIIGASTMLVGTLFGVLQALGLMKFGAP